MQKTYLVAGATGRVGGEVVQALLARGEQVRVLVRTVQQAQAFTSDRSEVIGCSALGGARPASACTTRGGITVAGLQWAQVRWTINSS